MLLQIITQKSYPLFQGRIAMLKNLFVFIFFLLCFSTSYPQYLTLDDYKELVELAADKEEADNFLLSRDFKAINFEYIYEDGNEEDDTTSFFTDYYKKTFKDYYYVSVYIDTDEEEYLIKETSSNEDRSFYFAKELSEDGWEPEDDWNNEDGEGFRFDTGVYEMIIAKSIDEEDEPLYYFMISIN